MVCAVGALAGCGREENVVDADAAQSEAVVESAAADLPVDGWTAMDTLAAGRWEPIPGAQELEWDDDVGVLRIDFGTDLNGVRWTGPLPTVPYQVELEARRMSGNDFFCGLTFPVRSGAEHVTLIVGGWGGNLVGISSIDGMDASENSTGTMRDFENQRWYRIRLEVREERIQVWIDDARVVDADTEDQQLSLRSGPIEDCAPFGLATWATRAEARGIRWRPLDH